MGDLHLENYGITHARIITADGMHHFIQLLLTLENDLSKRNDGDGNRILELHWGASTKERSSRLDVRISNVFEDKMGSGCLAGMQKVHKKWKLFEFLEEVVDPTGIRYALMRCNVFKKIPSLSKRKKIGRRMHIWQVTSRPITGCKLHS